MLWNCALAGRLSARRRRRISLFWFVARVGRRGRGAMSVHVACLSAPESAAHAVPWLVLPGVSGHVYGASVPAGYVRGWRASRSPWGCRLAGRFVLLSGAQAGSRLLTELLSSPGITTSRPRFSLSQWHRSNSRRLCSLPLGWVFVFLGMRTLSRNSFTRRITVDSGGRLGRSPRIRWVIE
jgi:hypothetical protein